MTRTIVVKGTGKVSAKPDYVVISLELRSKDMKYDKAMDSAGLQIQHLTETICAIGFDKKDLKTVSFHVRTDYKNSKDKNGEYTSIFKGYVIEHHLKLGFDFDTWKLSQALAAISGCISNPELSIAFTVKDATVINEEMLRTATINAKRKAEILCEASGVKLGELLNIDYNWGELNIFSRTQYMVAEDCMNYAAAAPSEIDIEPDDIDVSDSATFTWEIH